MLMKSLSYIQPKSSFVEIQTRVNGTDDAKDVLIASQRAFNYKCFSSFNPLTANQISYFN